MWALKLLLIPLFFYFAFLALIFTLQTRILFPAGMVGGAGPLPRKAERLSFAAGDGTKLHGAHIPPATEPSGGRTLVLGFGGNAWNADTAAAYLHDLYPAADVVTFHYRGYAPSGGAPSARALVEDAPLVHDFAVARLRPSRVIAIGFSIGSGVAAGLAARRKLNGLILVTPFDSLEKVASGHYRWLPVKWLFRHPMPAAEWLSGNEVPVAIIAAEGDRLIPPERTDGLRAAVRNLVLDRTIAGAGHNDLYHVPAFHSAMREAMAKLERSTSTP